MSNQQIASAEMNVDLNGHIAAVERIEERSSLFVVIVGIGARQDGGRVRGAGGDESHGRKEHALIISEVEPRVIHWSSANGC